MFYCVYSLAREELYIYVQRVSHFYQPNECSTAGWSYSYLAIFEFVCLSVCLSVRPVFCTCAVCHYHGHRLLCPCEVWERVNGVAAGTHGWFELAGLFASSLLRKPNDANTTNSRGTALLAQARYCERAPEGRTCQETGGVQPGSKLQWWESCVTYSTPCPISELHGLVDSQRQLECSCPPVGRACTTCMYVCMYGNSYLYVVPGWFLDILTSDLFCNCNVVIKLWHNHVRTC